jgi:hypothetical protein
LFVKLFTFLSMLSITSACSASILTFEGLDDQMLIPNSYGGLNWDNMYALDAGAFGSGYRGGVVSGTNIAFNGFGDLAVTSGSVFDSGLTVTVEGYLSGSLMYSSTVQLLDPTDTLGAGATRFAFNFLGVDELRFSTNFGSQFAMDDFEINAAPATVPEPGSIAVWSLGLGAVCFLNRCRKSSRFNR